MTMLPKIKHNIYTTKYPGTDRVIKFRPFTVKEEELLLIAKESESREIIYSNLIAVIENCTGEKDVESWPSYVFEHVFIQIRAKSVDEIVKLRFKCDCKEDGKARTEIDVRLPDVKVRWREDMPPDTIKVESENGDIFIKLKYPSISDQAKVSDDEENNFDRDKLVIKAMIEKIYDDERVYRIDTIADEEFIAWVNDLETSTKDSIKEFLAAMPQLEHDIEYTCSECGEKKKNTVKGLLGFFTLG